MNTPQSHTLVDFDISLRPRFATYWMIAAGVFGVLIQYLAVLLFALTDLSLAIHSSVGLILFLLAPNFIAGIIVGASAQDGRTLECFLGGFIATALLSIANSLPYGRIDIASLLLGAFLLGVSTALGAFIARMLKRANK